MRQLGASYQCSGLSESGCGTCSPYVWHLQSVCVVLDAAPVTLMMTVPCNTGNTVVRSVSLERHSIVLGIVRVGVTRADVVWCLMLPL
jgi:hypothetical protein